MRPGGRDRIGIRVILHHDGVSLAAMSFKNGCQLGGFAHRVGAAGLRAHIGQWFAVSRHLRISFHSAQ